MSKDGPKSGRMGFGFQQAKESGVPHKGSKSSHQMNLDNFMKLYPHTKDDIRWAIKSGRKAQSILEELREKGRGERYSIEFFDDTQCNISNSYRYSNNLAELKTDAEQKVRVGMHAGAQVFEFDYEKKKWAVVGQWP